MADAPVAAGRLRQVLPDWTLSSSPIHLWWLPGADRNPALGLLTDDLVAALAVDGAARRARTETQFPRRPPGRACREC